MALMLRVMLMLVLLPGLALAQDGAPAEPPPADFPARQYIDSRGCVFRRDDAGRWQARRARDGTPICGYPPSLSLRGLNGRPRLRALDPDAGRSRAERLEQVLSETVITNLHEGELAGDPRPMEKLPDLGPEPASSAPAEALKAAVAAAPAVRQGMAGLLQPNRRLCELLGHDEAAGTGRAGRDPTRGFCGSLSDTDLARLSFVRPLGTDPAPAPVPAAGPFKAVTGPLPVAARLAGQDVKAGDARAGDARARPASTAGMIPAGARYVQLGAFADAAQAKRATRHAARLGYPVRRGRSTANGREVQVILAGPFEGREAIVRALDALRKAGYVTAAPR